MSRLTSKKLYSGIDLFKLIASILVVLLHAIETTDFIAKEVQFVFTRFAVPFFFITSGFFFYKGLTRTKSPREYFWKYEKQLLLLFVVWVLIIDLPFTVVSYFRLYDGANPLYVILVIFRKVFIVGPSQYWYLVALILSSIVLYLLHNKKNVLLYILISVCFFLQFSYSGFRGVLSNLPLFEYVFKVFDFVFSWEFNFIMYGIPFMGIGYLIAKKDFSIPRITSVVLFVLATIVRFFEYHLPSLFPSDFWLNNHISFAFIVQAFAFFMLAQEITVPIKQKTSLVLRQLSSFIYFAHEIFMYNIVDSILRAHAIDLLYAPWFIVPKMILSLIPCVVLFFIIKRINNKYLNVLING